MELEWDEVKRRANMAKHGLDFADVSILEWDTATVLEDTRRFYPEHGSGRSRCEDVGCMW